MTSDEAFRLLDRMLSEASPRKKQLFGVACCRSVWPLMTDARHREVVVTTERLADGAAPQSDVDRAMLPVIELWRDLPDYRSGDWEARHYMTGATRHMGTTLATAYAASYAARGLGRVAGPTDSPAWDRAREAEQLVQVKLAEDITGPAGAGQWLDPTWRTTAVVGLARGIYEDRAFDRMPVLADALEDAGCTHPDILAHCRGEGPHARGCWVVDLVLGKG